jgi:ABC-type bacteriocin/lantibiotic exporter with double-glycine peptidase domain
MIYTEVTKKVYSILNKKEKIGSFFLLFLIFITIILETFGIASFFPLMSAIVDENYFSNPFYQRVSAFLGIESIDLNLFFIFFISFFIFKNIYLVFFAYWQQSFTNKISLRISNDLYSSYLHKNFSYHLKSNSAFLIRNIQESTSIDAVFLRILSLINEFFLIAGIIILLFYVNFIATLSIIIIVILTLFIFNLFTKGTIKSFGEKKFNMNARYMQNLFEGMHAFKEILLFNKKNFFIKNNFKYRKRLLDYQLIFSIISYLPRALIEIIAIISILILLNLLVKNQGTIQEIIPIVGVFSASAFRLFPSALKIFSALQSFNYVKPVIDNIEKEIRNRLIETDYNEKKDLNENQEIVFENEINISNINFQYLTGKILLTNVNLNIKKGTTVGIIGKSGAGKSTFLNIFTGLLKPTKGSILVDSIDIATAMKLWRKKIGYVSQDIFLLDSSIAENIAFGMPKENIDYNKVKNCIILAELDTYIRELKEGLNTTVGEKGVRISGGQRQRLGLARALYHEPDILILDEATNSLDINTENTILNTLKNLKNKFTILIISHHKNPLMIADVVYELKSNTLQKK